MALMHVSTLEDLIKLIEAAHVNNDLDEVDGRPTKAQVAEIIYLLHEHVMGFAPGELLFLGEEDIDMAMELTYGELYVYDLGGSLHAR